MKNRRRYPKHWHRIAQECKDRANWRCEKCGVRHGTLRRSVWTGRVYPVWLQAAHPQHDPENETPELVCVCPSCHFHSFKKPGVRPAWVIEKIKHRKLLTETLYS